MMSRSRLIMAVVIMSLFNLSVWPAMGGNPPGQWKKVETINRWSPRYAHALVTMNDRLWVLGGWDYHNGSPKNDVWSMVDESNWFQATPAAAWAPCGSPHMAIANGKMWLLGAEYPSGNLNGQIWSSDDGASWTLVTEHVPYDHREGQVTLGFNNKIWVMGGWDYPAFQRDVWNSDDGVSWTRVATRAAWPNTMGPAAVFKDKMWLLDRINRKIWSSDNGTTWTVNTPTVTWNYVSADYCLVAGEDRLWLAVFYYPGNSQPYVTEIWSSDDGALWTRVSELTIWQNGRGISMAWHQGRLWITIGSNANRGGDESNEIWRSEDGIQWTLVENTAVWSPRSLPLASAFMNKMWILGGKMNNADPTIYSSTDGRAWKHTPFPFESYGVFGMWNYQGRLWALGNDFLMSNDDGTSWAKATSPYNYLIANAANLVFSDRMWSMGGGWSSPNANIISSNDGTNWSIITSDQWPKRSGHQGFVFKGQAWVMGGLGSDGTTLGDLWRSDDMSSWTQMALPPDWVSRADFGAVVYHNKLWVLGGRNRVKNTSGTLVNAYLNDIWCSEDGLNWTRTAESAPWSPRSGISTVVHDNKIWLLGGNNPNEGYYKNEIWTYEEDATAVPAVHWTSWE